MQSIGTIRRFETRNFSIVIDAVEDYDIDLSWDETGEVREKLENGEFQSFTVRAIAYLYGAEIASDYLGGCIYADIAEFQDHRQCGAQNRKLRAEGSNAVCGSYFSDMVRSVCEQARDTVRKMQSIRVRA